jgi:hypothetical protein
LNAGLPMMIASSPSQSMLRPGGNRVALVRIDDARARRLGEEDRIFLVLIGFVARLLLRAAGREHLAGVQLVIRGGRQQVVGYLIGALIAVFATSNANDAPSVFRSLK